MSRHFHFGLVIVFAACGHGFAAEPPRPKVTTTTRLTASIVDANGETAKLDGVRFTAGLRRLAWLADPKGKDEDARKGPLAFEFRETNSSTYVNGVLTLVPLTAIESLTYNFEKKTATLLVAGLTTPLVGSIEYTGFNTIAIEADVDRGAAGLAVVKYRGGIIKGGIRSITFTNAKPSEVKTPTDKSKIWSVQILDAKAKNPTFTTQDLVPLYRLPDTTEKTIPLLPFEKTLKLDWAGLRSYKQLQPAAKGQAAEYEVTSADGKPQTLTPLTTLDVDGKKATLLGLIGTVPAGYKLIPMHTMLELKPEAAKEK